MCVCVIIVYPRTLVFISYFLLALSRFVKMYVTFFV